MFPHSGSFGGQGSQNPPLAHLQPNPQSEGSSQRVATQGLSTHVPFSLQEQPLGHCWAFWQEYCSHDTHCPNRQPQPTPQSFPSAHGPLHGEPTQSCPFVQSQPATFKHWSQVNVEQDTHWLPTHPQPGAQSSGPAQGPAHGDSSHSPVGEHWQPFREAQLPVVQSAESQG